MIPTYFDESCKTETKRNENEPQGGSRDAPPFRFDGRGLRGNHQRQDAEPRPPEYPTKQGWLKTITGIAFYPLTEAAISSATAWIESESAHRGP